MRWVVIGVAVLAALVLVFLLYGAPRRPAPQRSIGRSMRILSDAPDRPDDRSDDE